MLDKMLKAAGFDADSLKKQVDDASVYFNNVIEHFDKRLDVIEKQNEEIIALLKNDPKYYPPLFSAADMAEADAMAKADALEYNNGLLSQHRSTES